MSDVMFYGVLRMPFEPAMCSELARRQFYARAQEAADRVERLEAELARHSTSGSDIPVHKDVAWLVDAAEMSRHNPELATKIRANCKAVASGSDGTAAANAANQPRDNCKMCLGAKGGVRGNENVIGGVVVCDYCTSTLMDMKAAGWFGPDDAEPKIMASQAAAHGIDPGDGTGWVPFPIPCGVSMNTRMHLTREHVAALLPALQHFVDTGDVSLARNAACAAPAADERAEKFALNLAAAVEYDPQSFLNGAKWQAERAASRAPAAQAVDAPSAADDNKYDLQHARLAKIAANPAPVAAHADDLLNAEELAALRRFDECAQDGEGYDVPKEMMQRLAEIGVVRRKSGAYYEATEFGLRVLDRAPSAAPGKADAANAGGQIAPQSVSDERKAFEEYWNKLEAGDATEEELEMYEAVAWLAWQARPRHCLALPLSAYVTGTTYKAIDSGGQTDREAFEAWHRSKFATKHLTGQPTRDMHNGIYAEQYGPTNQQQMWEAWQAATSAADVKDAARYRWLRDEARDCGDPDYAPIVVMMDWTGQMLRGGSDDDGMRSGEDLDDAIDAAIAASQKGGA